ncbi:MAG: 50S ribosomal protein L29 [Candidatus Omnitrophica bacterium]|nr:50S ribosomal protein L29 [Candidatus Omnitrophota bacterium]MDD5574306.1 50S ribosomal protein L29 [Candidatus Omnitrophota bacterium]
MKIAELRNLSKEDLSVKKAALQEELGRLHYSKTIGQVEKPHRFKELRRSIARIETLLRQPEKSKE